VVALAACGREVPPPGLGPGPRPPRLDRRVEPIDLVPADLDLVVRVDVARMRSGLGPAAADELAARALGGSGAERGSSPRAWTDASDELLREAARRADVVWVALRLADLEAGDRVLAFEGPMRGLSPDLTAWQPVPEDIQGVTIFERRSATPRAGAARVIVLGHRALVFVSPVEVSSVARVLRDGPDERRGDPAAEGIVSLDLRAGRLAPGLERRFPSIARVIAGVERIRATGTLTEEGVRLEAEIVGRTPEGAGRARRFLEVLRDNVQDLRYAEIMRALAIEQVERTVRLRWTLPSRVVLALIAGQEPG
jgi:hypothetical protein